MARFLTASDRVYSNSLRPLIDMDGINPTEVKSKAKSTDMLDIIEIEKNNAIRNLHA
jgi:hypothetical protein